MGLLKNLKNNGAVIVEELSLYRESKQLTGYMWSGGTIVEHEGVKYYFGMWKHFEEDRDMTEEESLDFFILKAIELAKTDAERIADRDSFFGAKGSTSFYESQWHVFYTDNLVLLNRRGWSELSDVDNLKGYIEEKRKLLATGKPVKVTAQEREVFKEHGFELIVSF